MMTWAHWKQIIIVTLNQQPAKFWEEFLICAGYIILTNFKSNVNVCRIVHNSKLVKNKASGALTSQLHNPSVYWVNWQTTPLK